MAGIQGNYGISSRGIQAVNFGCKCCKPEQKSVEVQEEITDLNQSPEAIWGRSLIIVPDYMKDESYPSAKEYCVADKNAVEDYRNYLINECGYESTSADDRAEVFAQCLKSHENY